MRNNNNRLLILQIFYSLVELDVGNPLTRVAHCFDLQPMDNVILLHIFIDNFTFCVLKKVWVISLYITVVISTHCFSGIFILHFLFYSLISTLPHLLAFFFQFNLYKKTFTFLKKKKKQFNEEICYQNEMYLL